MPCHGAHYWSRHFTKKIVKLIQAEGVHLHLLHEFRAIRACGPLWSGRFIYCSLADMQDYPVSVDRQVTVFWKNHLHLAWAYRLRQVLYIYIQLRPCLAIWSRANAMRFHLSVVLDALGHQWTFVAIQLDNNDSARLYDHSCQKNVIQAASDN